MDKKDDNTKIEYSIPGVIIPEQNTEHGVIGGGTTNNNVSANTNINVGNTTQNSSININTEPQVASITPNVNLKGEQSNNQQEVGAYSNNISPIPEMNTNYPNNVNMQQNTNIVTPPPSTTNKKIKKNKKEKKNTNSPFLVFLVIILMGVIGYFVYNDYFAPKEVVDPVKELERKRSINNNSLVVQQLYNYINLDGCGDQINFFYGSGAPVELKDLTNEQKNYLAFRQLLNKDINREYCSTYSKALHKNDKMSLWYCGEEYLQSNSENFNDEDSITNIINEDILKKQVEKMFGNGSYKAETFTISTSLRYLYDQTTSSYIYQTFYGKDTCKGYSNKLDSAYRKGDYITIIVKVVNNESKNITMFHYTFRETDDGNYIFSNLVKKAV